MPSFNVSFEEITAPPVASWFWHEEGGGHFERQNDNEIVLKAKPATGYGIGALGTTINLPNDLKPLDEITVIWRYHMYKVRGVGDGMWDTTRLITFNRDFININEEHVTHHIPATREWTCYPTSTYFRDMGLLNDFKIHLRLDHVASSNSMADHIGNDKVTVYGVKVFIKRSNDAFSSLL